jgi:hypothetical protein
MPFVNWMAAPELHSRVSGGKAMDTGSLVSEDTLIGDRLVMQTESQSTGLQDRFASAGAADGPVLSNTDQHPPKSGQVRSIVAGRFMHMLRSHDRVRSKLLAAAK